MLSKRETNLAIEALDRVWTGSRECDVCNKPVDWTVHALHEFRDLENSDKKPSFLDSVFPFPPPVCPVLSVLCNECGKAMFFGAIRIGLIDKETGDFVKRKSVGHRQT